MAKRKTPEQKADEERRRGLARAAGRDDDFVPFFTDPNQAIRNEAAVNPNASARVLDRFADDRFWSVRVTVAHHPNTSRTTLLRLLEPDPRRRGVVHAETRRRLEGEGVVFNDDGMPLES
ncbi:hypothetical protein [Microlunatus sp. Y2014]|uniref:hypothetical protein n=1 Tax=Microlunatus sp. Y2014 TaxID=3418488 RepID=UPI003DA72432